MEGTTRSDDLSSVAKQSKPRLSPTKTHTVSLFLNFSTQTNQVSPSIKVLCILNKVELVFHVDTFPGSSVGITTVRRPEKKERTRWQPPTTNRIYAWHLRIACPSLCFFLTTTTSLFMHLSLSTLLLLSWMSEKKKGNQPPEAQQSRAATKRNKGEKNKEFNLSQYTTRQRPKGSADGETRAEWSDECIVSYNFVSEHDSQRNDATTGTTAATTTLVVIYQQ